MDLPLGTGLGPDFSRQRLKVPPGDRVLLVTDGVLEAPAPDGAEFGVAGVEAALVGGPEAIAERLLTALRAHTGGDELTHDDVTFFVGEFVDGPPGPTLWKVLKNRGTAEFHLGRGGRTRPRPHAQSTKIFVDTYESLRTYSPA